MCESVRREQNSPCAIYIVIVLILSFDFVIHIKCLVNLCFVRKYIFKPLSISLVTCRGLHSGGNSRHSSSNIFSICSSNILYLQKTVLPNCFSSIMPSRKLNSLYLYWIAHLLSVLNFSSGRLSTRTFFYSDYWTASVSFTSVSQSEYRN